MLMKKQPSVTQIWVLMVSQTASIVDLARNMCICNQCNIYLLQTLNRIPEEACTCAGSLL